MSHDKELYHVLRLPKAAKSRQIINEIKRLLPPEATGRKYLDYEIAARAITEMRDRLKGPGNGNTTA